MSSVSDRSSTGVENGAGTATPLPRRVEPTVRGNTLLSRLYMPFQQVDRLLAFRLPEGMNPFLQAGAIANTSFMVAAVTGILLLFFYTPSVYSAYTSVQEMADSPLTAELLRSLHRYSSDACMCFVLFHAVKTFFARKFDGARWLAWTTGILLLGMLWFIGWLGYWLVWDERARQIALGTGRMLDVLPIFADPLTRSFLTDQGVNTLLFFLVFFAHMLLPLVMAVALWIHITRMARAHFLTRGPMTWWVLGSLIALSLLIPATSAEPARMAVEPQGFSMDWWYLLPVAFTDRLGAGILWSLVLVSGAVLFSMPWWATRRRPTTAVTITALCNACQNCYADCPYNAITMVPRQDGRSFPTQSEVDPARCVGCGVCVGSCCSGGINLPELSTQLIYDRIDAWVEEDEKHGVPFRLALLAADGAMPDAVTDARSGQCPELPGYRCVEVPCGGSVNPLVVERAMRRGASAVLVAGCAPATCATREGANWSILRFAGQRDPSLREPWRDDPRVRVLTLHSGERAQLLSAALALRDGASPVSAGRAKRPRFALVSGLLLTGLIAGVIWWGSDLGYASPDHSQPTLVVSFKHPGQYVEVGQALSAEELEKLPMHMRPQSMVGDRSRVDVRLRVHVDGALVLEKSYPPRGIWGDGNSMAVEKVPVAAGQHEVRIQLGDSPLADEWSFETQDSIEFEPYINRVILFDRVKGFQWH